MAEREQISMSPPEVDAFLRAKDRLFLGLLDGEGAPTATTSRYVYEDGYLYFTLPSAAPELARLRRDARVCAIVEQVPSYYEIKAVTLHGRAEEVSDDATRARLRRSLGEQSPIGDGQTLLRIPLMGVVSFDFAKIQRRP
jgi:nitroimidazol reductase NimA-like FMN-containing flavoprotein (pyridoxamine 5'-phosphate oxidase superfamily)